MDKSVKLLLTLVIIIAFSLGALYLFLNRDRIFKSRQQAVETEAPVFPTSPQKGDLGYEEPQTTVEIGTQGVTKGTFDKVEEGNIFLREGNKLTELPLTVDEVVLACSNQDLAATSVLDYDQVASVKISNPQEIGGLIPPDEPAVIFASDVEGVLRVHTVAIAVSKCPK